MAWANTLCYSMAPIIYTTNGDKISEQLWNETLAELEPFGVKEILQEIPVRSV